MKKKVIAILLCAVMLCTVFAACGKKEEAKNVELNILTNLGNTGTVLTFARALGEYGATSMVSGYIPGRTATIATTVYQLWQTNNDALAVKWVMVNLAISACVLLTVNMLERKDRAR